MSWQPFSTAPTNGTKFDVWCLPPNRRGTGARFTDVQMRGDKSGFGIVVHYRDRTEWHYLDARGTDPIYPEWVPMWWMPTPAGPGEAGAQLCQPSPFRMVHKDVRKVNPFALSKSPFDPTEITLEEVKEYRVATGAGLMEAKAHFRKKHIRDAVDTLRKEGSIEDIAEFLLNRYEETL